MTNHRPLHNNIYHYVSHHTMIAIHISVTVNMVSWGICMNVEIDEVLILHQVLPLFFSVTTAVTPAELHLMTFQGDTPVNSQLLLKE